MIKRTELEHGRNIADRAEEIWGWASKAGQLRAERRANLLIARAGIAKGLNILEIGCGTGVFTAKLAVTIANITATDISPELLERARERVPNARFQIADAERMPFAKGVFDGVVGSSILHHLNLEVTLKEMYRVLKPGGRLAFAEPNMLNPQVMLQKNIPALKKRLGDTPDETAFFRGRLAHTLRENGFAKVKVEPFDFLHPATPALLISLVQRAGSFLEEMPLFREIAGSLIISAIREGTPQ
ncbi:MAG: class I SAM-dependent methyltransferase [Anaerolineae bacterium]